MSKEQNGNGTGAAFKYRTRKQNAAQEMTE
jgi:hypothetical protein